MLKKLSPVGNSLGLIIDRPILDLLNITRDTPLEVTTDGDSLLIRPIRESKKERVRVAAKRVMSMHAPALRKLAK